MAVLINASTSSGLQLTPDTSGAIAFQNNGTTAATIDSSGNMGINQTPFASAKLASSPSATQVSFMSSGTNSGGSAGYPSFGFSGQVSSNAGRGAGMFLPADSVLAFSTTAAERMRIDSSGNVGIGSQVPSGRLQVNGTGAVFVDISGDSTNECQLRFATNTTARINQIVNQNLAFSTNNIDRMRLTSAGELWINNGSDQGAYFLQVGGSGVWGAGAYVNGSDERIKENIEPISSCLEIVQNLKPVTFKYKEDWSRDQSTQTGFIAQDLQQALSGQVYLEGVVQQGAAYLNVAYQSLIPILTKALQEANAKIDALTESVEALEARP